jgi:hypothetical protein
MYLMCATPAVVRFAVLSIYPHKHCLEFTLTDRWRHDMQVTSASTT